MKRRLIVVTGIIVVVLIVAIAFVASSTAATALTVAQAADGTHTEQRVQVSGNVVANSYETTDNTLTFAIYDPDESADQLNVSFEGVPSATFGNDITAICTGKIGNDGILYATELVTKCPSKYESATDALSISDLYGYGDNIIGTIVKIEGVVEAGSLQAAGQGDRFVLVDESDGTTIAVDFSGALSDEIQDGTALVLTGHLAGDGTFAASDVAVRG